MEHALFVIDDDLRGSKIKQALQAVVAVDHAAIEIVEVAGGESATVKLHHRAELWWDYRNDIEDHCTRVIQALARRIISVNTTVERCDDLQTLNCLLLTLSAERLLAILWVDCLTEFALFFVEVDSLNQRLDGIGASATFEVLAVTIGEFAPQQFVFENEPRVHALELFPGTLNQIDLSHVALAQGFNFFVGIATKFLRINTFGFGNFCFRFEFFITTVDLEFKFFLELVLFGEVLGLET